MPLAIHPLTPDRWPDHEALFDAKGSSIAQRSHGEFAPGRPKRIRSPRGARTQRAGGAQLRWHGAKSMFDAADFEEVARRKPQRPVVRPHLGRP